MKTIINIERQQFCRMTLWKTGQKDKSPLNFDLQGEYI